ncbi:MAG: hypothetical protein KJI71_01420 [Patescibacteria group bacterium]|nr:hypothetical protein [Patescibacteria group bacterium]
MKHWFLLNAYQPNEDLPEIRLLAVDPKNGEKVTFRIQGFKFRFFIPDSEMVHASRLSNFTSFDNNQIDYSLMGTILVKALFKKESQKKSTKKIYKSNNIPVYQSDVSHCLAFRLDRNLKRWFTISSDSLMVSYQDIDGVLDKDIIPSDDIAFNYRMGYLDIETSNERVLSVAFTDEHITTPLIDHAVQFYHIQGEEIRTIGHNIYQALIYPKKIVTEEDLIIQSLTGLSECHILMSYNEDFDVPFLLKRAKKLGIDKKLIEKIAHIPTFCMMKCYAEHFDYHDFVKLKLTFKYIHWFKQDAIKLLPELLQNYDSDSMSRKYIEYRSKQKGTDAAGLDSKSLAFYNSSDTLDMIALRDAVSMTSFLDIWRFNGLNQTSDSYVHTKRLDIPALFFLNLNNVRATDKTYKHKEKMAGAFAFETISGLHYHTMKIDFSRFYSTIIRGERLSPERFINKKFVPFMDILPDGTKSDKPFMFLTAFAEFLAKSRGKTELQADLAVDKKEETILRAKAKVQKTMDSGFWGYISQESSRFYRLEIKRTILERSREFIKGYGEYYKSQGYKVLSGFTDSIDIKLRDMDEKTPYDIAAIGNKWLEDKCKSLGWDIVLIAKPEVVASASIFHGKLHYAQRIIWRYGDQGYHRNELLIKGMAVIRSDYALLGRELQRELLEIVLTDQNYLKKSKKIYKEYYDKTIRILHVDQDKMEEVAKPTKFREELDKYKKGSYKFLASSAKAWNIWQSKTEFPYDVIKPGDKPFAIPLKKGWVYNPARNVKFTRWLVFQSAEPIEWNKVRIDKTALLDVGLRNRALTVLEHINVSYPDLLLWERGEVQQELVL